MATEITRFEWLEVEAMLRAGKKVSLFLSRSSARTREAELN